MAKIFISHSSKNRELIKTLVEFLQMGMGVSRGEIFCTSYPESLPTGEQFIEAIREEMRNCEVVFFVITEDFLKSQFCLTEMGAAWGLGKRIYPLMLVKLEKIENTPLKGLQVRFLEKKSDINTIYDELRNYNILTRTSITEYINRIDEFLRQVQVYVNGEYMLQVSDDGYYHTEILEERQVPSEYCCYKIKGHIAEWQHDNDAKSDWLFYRVGVYDKLQVGEKVKFKISKTDVNRWADIGLARNVYPADLEKE